MKQSQTKTQSGSTLEKNANTMKQWKTVTDFTVKV